MKTFEEKLLESFEEELQNKELNSELISYIMTKIVQEAVEYDRNKGTDLKTRAKALTNSILTEGEQLNIIENDCK